jgi:hypothetical protein
MGRGGWADLPATVAEGLSCDAEAYTVADAWTPPHALSLRPEMCDRLHAAAIATPASANGNGSYHLLELNDDDRAAIVARFEHVNDLWWNLDIDRWEMHAKRYDVGDCHPPHQDLHPGAAGRKIAGSAQLSSPDSYSGGELVIHFAHHRIPMPRDRGALVVVPGWTVHEVQPVTSGTRWALIVNGFGPPLK